ncbi:hypothetical protein E3N88_09557 [Mikania micrantha]|uniref:Uncharacterized protein n=1 Tax=Mikania micrantha TaxID=192012 RepID=A0A5N6PLC5_9ASTR|nr:hypothetical protein E3N88_09557 [Mikania micrantha]
MDSEDDVQTVGIWGMGGAGKTTLARAVFDHISIWFEGNSFVENVRECSKGSLSGLKKLQKQVLKDVLNDQSIHVTSISDGINKMKKTMPGRKVLVVLDDVDDIDQLEALAGNANWFKPGSRIIITTRDKQVLIAQGVNADNIYNISLLSREEAICLFSRHAFRREVPIQGYEELSGKVVHYAAGLPLTVKVLGSFLYGITDQPKWVDTLERLKTIPLEKTLKKLEISYDGLENDHKEIFLDVACILKGEPKDKAIKILEGCGFHAQIGLEVLEQKSLINILDYGTLSMHDHLEEMGRNIVRRLHPDEPNRHSRLWVKKEIEEILINDLGTKATRSMNLMYPGIHPAIVMKSLRKMKELRLLCVFDGNKTWEIDEGVEYLPNSLRSLNWSGFALSCLPQTFQANNLVNLEMPWSYISQLWEGGERKVLEKLRFIDLFSSKLRTFDLGMTRNLETLNLKIHAPVGSLKKLTSLKLNGCSRFEYVGVSIHQNSLAMLELIVEPLGICPLHPNSNLPKFKHQCKYGEVLPLSGGNIEKLISFGLCACTNLESFSASICGLQHLTALTLEGCIPEVPKDLWKLESLEQLTLSMKEINHLPDNICMLKHLKYLDLKSCWLLEQLPMDLGGLQCLEELHLTDCISLRDIPNNICKLKFLKKLHLPYCIQVEKLPEELGPQVWSCSILKSITNFKKSKLPKLKFLKVSGSKVVEMSDGSQKTRCKYCDMLLAKESNTSLKKHITKPFCKALKNDPESQQTQISNDGRIFHYNVDAVRDRIAKFVI